VVREGYEGLVRGNTEAESSTPSTPTTSASNADVNLIHNLRFGDGQLLRDGTGDYIGGRTLKGRYIVRVGWDDVRGWFSEVAISLCSSIDSALSLLSYSIGWYINWKCSIENIPHTRRSPGSRT
jgi:hypothetical protein